MHRYVQPPGGPTEHEDIERAMKETLYHNLRKLHIRFHNTLEAACTWDDPEERSSNPYMLKTKKRLRVCVLCTNLRCLSTASSASGAAP